MINCKQGQQARPSKANLLIMSRSKAILKAKHAAKQGHSISKYDQEARAQESSLPFNQKTSSKGKLESRNPRDKGTLKSKSGGLNSWARASSFTTLQETANEGKLESRTHETMPPSIHEWRPELLGACFKQALAESKRKQELAQKGTPKSMAPSSNLAA